MARKKKVDAAPEVKTEEVKVEETKAEEAKVETAEAAQSTEGVAATEETTETPVDDEKDKVREEIDELIKQYNEASEYIEYKRMREIEAKIAEKVQQYDELAEGECFAEFLQSENPMKAAAEAVRFPTIKVRDERQKGGGQPKKVVEASSKPIDPMRLHKKAKDGIGANKEWHFMCEKLNLLLTCRRAIELGIDPMTVKNTYSMSDEAVKIECLLSETDATKYDKNAADEILKQDMQKVVDAMVGSGFTVTDVMVNYLLVIYQKKDNKKSLSVTCANHKFMRMYMLEICHAAITGNEFCLNFKVKK